MKTRDTSFILAVLTLSAAASISAEAHESTSLRADEIREALVGKKISYMPPGSADTGITEEFYPDGRWGGIKMARGPSRFSGHWSIDGTQMCVMADQGTVAERWHSGSFCRTVWQDRTTGLLRIEYLGDQPSSTSNFGLQTLTVSDLAL